jgi:arabinose-5-phosphate isomerase
MPKPAVKKTKLKSVPISPDIAVARAVIRAEADGLNTLADSLDQNFVRAVDAIHNMRMNKRGRLIVSGVGKSGHVANKMVATFASTAVPALFVHPAEASHGDLGMITESDVVMLISASGESREQSDLIAYCKRFSIPLIAITRKGGSTLGKAADIILLLPDVAEAFSDVVAPTTSTINTMALGDALAEALMKRIGLTPDQFRVFHPGGKLGAQLLRVSDVMLTGAALPIVSPTTTMDKAILVMTEKNVGCVIVTDAKGALHGIVTDGDLKRHMGPKLLAQKVSTVMSKKPKTIGPDVLAVQAVADMLRPKKGNVITSLVVCDGQKLKGLIRVQECLQAGLV